MNALPPIRHLKSVRAVLAVLGLLGLWGYRVPLWNAISMIGNPQAIIAYLQQFESYGLIVLCLLLLAQVFVALIPGQALVLAAGYLYGMATTMFIVASTTIVGSQLAFWLARRYGRPLIHKLASPKAIDYWDRLAGHLGPSFYLLAFLLPVFPSDMMCYVAGLGKVSPKGFFAANCIGRTISAAAYTLLGAYHFQPPLWFWIAVAIGLAVILTSWMIYKKTHFSKGDNR